MKIAKIILIIFTALVLALIFYSFTLPDKIIVMREVKINEEKVQVFEYLNDLNNFSKWTNWKTMDSTITYSVSPKSVGKGASVSWDGEKSQSAKLKITDTKPYQLIKFQLFNEDGELTFNGKFELESLKDETNVKWIHYNNVGWNPIMRLMGSMLDSVMGESFEKSLSKLKENLEK